MTVTVTVTVTETVTDAGTDAGFRLSAFGRLLIGPVGRSIFKMSDWRDYGPDYTGIDSLEKAQAALARGELEKVFLLPLAFGGTDVPQNFVYAAPGTNLMKNHIDEGIVRGLLAAGTVTRYRVDPEYQGSSMVPIALKISATEPGNYSSDLAIWGEALMR